MIFHHNLRRVDLSNVEYMKLERALADFQATYKQKTKKSRIKNQNPQVNVQTQSDQQQKPTIKRSTALKISAARKELTFVSRFLPNFPIRQIHRFYDDIDDASIQATINVAKQRMAVQLEKQYAEYLVKKEPFYPTWPSGFKFVKPSEVATLRWLEADPPRPFADRGGFIWPGHYNLKFNIQNYLPKIFVKRGKSRPKPRFSGLKSFGRKGRRR